MVIGDAFWEWLHFYMCIYVYIIYFTIGQLYVMHSICPYVSLWADCRVGKDGPLQGISIPIYASTDSIRGQAPGTQTNLKTYLLFCNLD